jgi:hypothetical protein
MNDVTKKLVDGLQKLKEMKPKLQSISYIYDLEKVFYLGEIPRYDDSNLLSYKIQFVGFIDFGEGNIKPFPRVAYSMPREIYFDIEYKKEIFDKIDFRHVNNAMGYNVIPESIMADLQSSSNQEDNKCSCDIDKLMSSGCSCGGE